MNDQQVRIPVAPTVAAWYAEVQQPTLRQWARRGHISPADPDGCYDLVEIQAWTEQRSTRHAVSARFQRHTHRATGDSPVVV